MDCDVGATAVSGEPICEIEFSFCSLVTKPHQYREMTKSFKAVGFDDTNSEFLYIDNTQGNSESAFSGLNRLARFARGKFIVFCHQDVVAIDGPDVIRTMISDLTEQDPHWAIAANAGCDNKRCYFYLNEPNHISLGPDRQIPKKVSTVDENFILLRRSAQLAFSEDLDGFHLYGADLVTQASIRGRSAYVIDFRVEHPSSGSVDAAFYTACTDFEKKFARAFNARRVTTTCTSLDLGTTEGPGRRDRIRNLERGFAYERRGARIRKALRGWTSGYTVAFGGTRFHYPRDISVAELQSLRKGRFEQERLQLIQNHLPKNLPNVVLGASYGVLCGLIRRKLQAGVPQIAIEKDPKFIDLCIRNSGIGASEQETSVFNRIISYQQGAVDTTPTSSDDAKQHAAVKWQCGPFSDSADVPAISLGKLLEHAALDDAYSLVCNIGGEELDLLVHDTAALSHCRMLLLTLHPSRYYRRKVLVTEFIKKLEAIGFEIIEVLGNHVATIPFEPDGRHADTSRSRK